MVNLLPKAEPTPSNARNTRNQLAGAPRIRVLHANFTKNWGGSNREYSVSPVRRHRTISDMPRSNMLARRALLATAGAALLAQRAAAAPPIPGPVPVSDSLTFRIMRFDREIGRHAVTFDRDGDALTVQIAMDVAVTFAGITFASYTHRGVETWQGNTLIGLAGKTNNNGDRGWMDARRTTDGLLVTGSKTARYIAPDQSGPASYWDKRMLHRPMISLEDGVASSRPTVTPSAASPASISGMTGPQPGPAWQ